MAEPLAKQLAASMLATWRTTNQVSILFIEQIPSDLSAAAIPGVPQRTIRMIAAHLHNARCRWIRTLGREHGVPAPHRVDHRRVTRSQLVAALKRSGKGIEALLRLAFAADGTVPPSKGYAWPNLQLDAGHVLAYFVAHEAHHRGQILMAARQMGKRLPEQAANGLWHWIARAKEA